MGLITETNQQYYQGAQGFLSATGAINEKFTTTFDTNLIFGDWNPANANYALNNFKLYTSVNGFPGTYTEYLLAYSVENNVINVNAALTAGTFVTVQLKTLDGGQYGQGQEGFGNLQGLLTSQAGSRLQDSASTLPSQVASQVYGLGMQGLQDRSAPTDIEALRSQYAGLAGQAGQGLLSTPEQRQADIYESIRATQTPEEQRQRLALEERLYNQGRMGVQTNMYGGAPEQFALAKAQTEAQNQAALMAMQQAQAEPCSVIQTVL